jgi:hypothetical protein
LWDFAVTAAVISDFFGNCIIMVATQRLHSTDILFGKSSAALLASWALSSGIDNFVLEGYAL